MTEGNHEKSHYATTSLLEANEWGLETEKLHPLGQKFRNGTLKLVWVEKHRYKLRS